MPGNSHQMTLLLSSLRKPASIIACLIVRTTVKLMSTTTADPDEFDQWFADLLEVPWEEYLAYDDELEMEQPARAPDAQTYKTDDDTPLDESCNVEQNQQKLTFDQALEQLNEMRKLFVDHDKLFDAVNQLYGDANTVKLQTEIESKTKHACITAFFNPRQNS